MLPLLLWHSQNHAGSQAALFPLPPGHLLMLLLEHMWCPSLRSLWKSHFQRLLSDTPDASPVSVSLLPISIKTQELSPPLSPGAIYSPLFLEPAHCLAHS